jgi:DNA-binding NarL/FixJ family response regulator
VVEAMPPASLADACTGPPLCLGEPGVDRALRTCLRVFEALGEVAGADACRRALKLDGPGQRPAATERLTPREQHVAALVAGGWTNSEIAQALHISPGTAGRHLANIFLKLGFHSRAQVASWYASCPAGE